MTTTPTTPTAPVVPTKATSAWSKLNLQQQQDFVKSHDGFDPSKYWLQYASAAPKALDYNLPWETPSTPQVPAVNPTPSPTTTATTPPQAAQPAWAALAVWTEPTTGTPNYQDDSEARLLETQNNLQAYYNQNPDLFTDRPTFDSTFHYGERSNLQKQTLDNFYNKRQYETQFGNLTSDDIAKKLVNAEITDTDLNWMKSYDAARYNEVMQKRAEQQTQIDNQNTLATMATQAGFKWFEDQMGLKDVNNNGIFDSFEVNQSPELKAAQEKSIQLNTQIEDIDKETETIQKDIESHYGSLSKGQLAALVRDRTVDLTMKRNAAVRELTAVNGTAKNLLEAQQQQQQGIKDSLAAFSQMYWVFNNQQQAKLEQDKFDYTKEKDTEAAKLAAEKAAEDKNVWKTVDIGTAKHPQVMMWNTKTQAYDIPLNGSGWGSSGGGSSSWYTTFKTTDSNDALIKTILASGTFTKDQKASLIDGIKNGGDIRAIAINQANNIMGQANATATTKTQQGIEQMKWVKALLDEYYKIPWAKTNIFEGNYQDVINKLWKVWDPKLANIAARIQKALQLYRNTVSGTAYSVQEWADIASIFPWINKSEALNRALIDAQIEGMQMDVDTAYNIALGGSYDEIKKLGQTKEIDTKKAAAQAKLDALRKSLSTPSWSPIHPGNIGGVAWWIRWRY